MVISHNLMAMNAQRQFGLVNAQKAKATEKLSSGFKINRSADDAAGLAISEKMRRQIRGLTQASSNAQDGISMMQTAEGGLDEVHAMLQRMNELVVKSSNGTLSNEDRQYVDSEIQQLKNEINRVADSTTFNEIQLFPSDGSSIVTARSRVHLNSDGTYTVLDLSDSYNFTPGNVSSNATATANYLADTLLPQAFSDIIGSFPALASDQGDLDIDVDLAYIDGSNGTLAYAQFSYYSNYSPVQDSFLIKVDTADFTDENALAGGSRNDLLKSTIYHELTHSVMQYTLSRGMASEYPTWFKEGAAQLAGGGFATGWNTGLAMIAEQMADASDTSQDAAYANYLRSATVEGRPYGHGYLAVAYMAQLASGSGTVNTASLQTGMNRIFQELRNGSSLSDAVQTTTGRSLGQVVSDINSGNTDAVNFVRQLSFNTGSGAGSAVYSSLSAGSQLMGALPSDASTSPVLQAASTINLQVGAESDQYISVDLFSIGTRSLGLEMTNALTIDDSQTAIEQVKNAIGVVSGIRSYYGAMQNRLEHTIRNLNNVVENTTAAESKIRDTDMAQMMVEYSNSNILAQAGMSMMAQANQSNQAVLSLLQ